MNNAFASFLSKKKIGFYITFAAAVLTIIAMICTLVAADKDDLGGIAVLFIVAILGSAVTMYKDFFGIGLLVSCVCAGAGFMLALVPQLNMIGLILNNVVEQSIPSSLIAAAVFTVLAMICNCVSGFMGVDKKIK